MCNKKKAYIFLSFINNNKGSKGDLGFEG